jgi:FMN phosphatase YigB (HAD superfamily)
MGDPARDRVLMVGDNPESDIQGGINAGLDTCWINADGRAAPADLTPTYEVTSLAELERLLLAARD